MEIKQAIEHARKVAEEKYTEGMLCHANPDDGKLNECIECAKQHEQLADWLEELQGYKDLEERLQSVYGECSGLLEMVVENLEQHENIELPEPVFKARLLTDGEVNRWEEFKELEEQGKLLKLPCKVGDTVYRIIKERQLGRLKIISGKVYRIAITETEMQIFIEKWQSKGIFGKTVFLTREEAETVLKEVK